VQHRQKVARMPKQPLQRAARSNFFNLIFRSFFRFGFCACPGWHDMDL
jgi:hypothetical protein